MASGPAASLAIIVLPIQDEVHLAARSSFCSLLFPCTVLWPVQRTLTASMELSALAEWEATGGAGREGGGGGGVGSGDRVLPRQPIKSSLWTH